MRYNLMLDNPKDFYHESHRTIHFLDFAVRASTNDENTTVDSANDKQNAGAQDSNMPDRDDFFLWWICGRLLITISGEYIYLQAKTS